ncbi:MAG TPA: hypothetical protein VFH44_05570 [Solirubrobacterales bacterium]|nr:hypothetical protein [Solirubrobacterales bacterium]
MSVIAHVGGLPVEELLPTLTSGAAGWLVARTWILSRLRRRRGTRR